MDFPRTPPDPRDDETTPHSMSPLGDMLGTEAAQLQIDMAETVTSIAKTTADLKALNGPNVRWSYRSANLDRVMHVYLTKLNPDQMQEFRAAEEIITRLAHSITEEERRVVRKERDE